MPGVQKPHWLPWLLASLKKINYVCDIKFLIKHKSENTFLQWKKKNFISQTFKVGWVKVFSDLCLSQPIMK